MIRFSIGGKTTVEQIVESEELIKTRKAVLRESQSVIQLG